MNDINWKMVALTLIRYLMTRDKAALATVLRRAGINKDMLVPIIREYVLDRKIREFHKRRVVFIALPTDTKSWPLESGLHVHMPDNCTLHVHWNYEGSHRQWVEEEIGVSWEKAKWCVRGFYYPPTNSVYFYHGDGTEAYTLCEDWFFRNKDYIRETLAEQGCTIDTRIYAGMKPGEPGTLWQPVKSYMTFRGID